LFLHLSLLIPSHTCLLCSSLHPHPVSPYRHPPPPPLPVNSKSTVKSFSNFGFIQTFHCWVTDAQRASIPLQDASVKAVTHTWVLVFRYWVSCMDRLYRQKSCLSTSSCYCSLPLPFLLQCTTGGSYMFSQSLSSASYWVYFPSGFLTCMFSSVYNIFLLSTDTYYSLLSPLSS